MAEVGLQEAETYVSRHQNTVAKYIVTRPIMKILSGREAKYRAKVGNEVVRTGGFRFGGDADSRLGCGADGGVGSDGRDG